jgi:hypothetical protein
MATRRTIYQARTTLSGVTIDDLSPDETMFLEQALTKAFQTIQDDSADDHDDTHIHNLIVVPQTNGNDNDRKLGRARAGGMSGAMHDDENGDESGRMLFRFFNTPPSFGQSWYYYDFFAFFDVTCFLCGGSQYDDDDDGYGHFSDKWDNTSSDEDDIDINQSFHNGNNDDDDDGHKANRWGASSTSPESNNPAVTVAAKDGMPIGTHGAFLDDDEDGGHKANRWGASPTSPDAPVEEDDDDFIPVGSYQGLYDDDDEYYNNKFGNGGRMLKETAKKAAGVKAKTSTNTKVRGNGDDAAAKKRKKHREVEEVFCAMLRDGPFDSLRGVEDCEITYGPV